MCRPSSWPTVSSPGHLRCWRRLTVAKACHGRDWTRTTRSAPDTPTTPDYTDGIQVLVVLDLQEGLYSLARDFDPTLFRDNIITHAAVGKAFNLPVILTSSAESGPNGKIPSEILDMYPNAPLIKRQGEVDAWDNAEFRAAIKATGRTQIILGGITTDVCMCSLLSREEGVAKR